MFWIGILAFIVSMAMIWCVVPLTIVALDGFTPGPLVWAYFLTGFLTAGWFAYMQRREPEKFAGPDSTIMLTFLVLVIGWPWAWAKLVIGFWRRYRD